MLSESEVQQVPQEKQVEVQSSDLKLDDSKISVCMPDIPTSSNSVNVLETYFSKKFIVLFEYLYFRLQDYWILPHQNVRLNLKLQVGRGQSQNLRMLLSSLRL